MKVGNPVKKVLLYFTLKMFMALTKVVVVKWRKMNKLESDLVRRTGKTW